MRVLVVANAPWACTAYALQMGSLALRLKNAGHTVGWFANWGHKGGMAEWQGIPVFPSVEENAKDTIISAHVRTFQPDLVLTLYDTWAFPGDLYSLDLFRWAAWTPVDCWPLSKLSRLALERVSYPIAMSRFGHNLISEAGFNSTFIPHGVEKTYGYTANGRREMRRYLEIPDDAFLFGDVGLNRYWPCRKGHDRAMEALAEIPDAFLYIHALPECQAGSMDLRWVAEFYGVQDRVRFPDPYNYTMGYSQNGMNSIYSAMDCLLQPTHGEGFGLPVLEAQACGTPVIATDCTSMPELLCPEASVLVPAAAKYLNPGMAYHYLIDVPKMVEAMKEAITLKRDDPLGWQSIKGRCGLWANNWDWDKLWDECWVPFIETVQAEIAKTPTTRYARGRSLLFEYDGRMRKQDSIARSVKKELDFLAVLDHPNIVPVLAYGDDEGKTWFDMPMLKCLRDVDCTQLSEEQRQRILTGVSEALNYLHERGLSHRDVCPSNILLDDEYNPYLADFAWAHPCEGQPCVDFEPWKCLDRAVPLVQLGAEERGYHTIVMYVRGITLREARATGLRSVPYQAIDGVGERDCELRWKIMKPDVKGKRVLDVGCNLGWFVRKALEEGASEAVGLDSDEPTIEAARELGAGEYHVMEAQSVDGRLGHFDVAFLLSVLQHVREPDMVLQNVATIADEIYVEIPPRFITAELAQSLKDAAFVGESDRGRPIYKVKASA